MTRSWTPWGDRLIASLAIGLAVSLLWWWVGVGYLDLPLGTYGSWKPIDEPTQVPPHFPTPILGDHYFGDFQESRWWGLNILDGASPYDYVNFYPPVSTWVMVPFALLPLEASFYAYALVTAAFLVTPVWLLLSRLTRTSRIVATVLTAVATGPFLATLDRGNLQGIVIGMAGFGLVALQRSRPRAAAALFAIAICLKPFMIVVVIIALARNRWRFGLDTLATSVILSFIGLLALPGGLAYNLWAYLASQEFADNAAGVAQPERIHANTGFGGLLARLSLIIQGSGHSAASADALARAGLVLAVAWLVLAWFVAYRRRLPQWVWGSIALSAVQLSQPFAAPYSLTWASLAAAWFGAGHLIPPEVIGTDDHTGDRWITSLRVITLAALVITLVPFPMRLGAGDYTMPVQQTLSPLAWLAVGLLAVAATIARPPRARPAAARVI